MLRMAIGFVLMLSLFTVPSTAQFTEWSAPVNVGPPVSSTSGETCASISKNGLSLYFASDRPGGTGGLDLYVSKRASVLDKWGKPQPLPNVNSVVQDSCPTLSPDEYLLYFVSARPGGCGMQDIYVSRRQDRRDDLGWQPPKNLGCQSEGHVNSSSRELTLTLFEDETGTEVMYFGSDRPGGAGRFDIYESRMRGDDTFGPATLVKELSGSTVEFCPAVRRDGLEIVFCSDRDGGKGNLDLWTASRESTEGSWSVPVNLAILNSTALDGNKMSFSFDGRQLYFTSDRSGKNQDLYVTTREKLHGQKK